MGLLGSFGMNGSSGWQRALLNWLTSALCVWLEPDEGCSTVCVGCDLGNPPGPCFWMFLWAWAHHLKEGCYFCTVFALFLPNLWLILYIPFGVQWAELTAIFQKWGFLVHLCNALITLIFPVHSAVHPNNSRSRRWGAGCRNTSWNALALHHKVKPDQNWFLLTLAFYDSDSCCSQNKPVVMPGSVLRC